MKEARVRLASSEHPSTTGVPIYITKPFCFGEGRHDIVFQELLQRICKEQGLHFLDVKWDKTAHCQKQTKTPNKHFNVRGVHLLVESLRGVCPLVPPGMSCGQEQLSAPSGMPIGHMGLSRVNNLKSCS